MENKQKVSISLKKAQSLLTKIQQMLDNGDYCIDIMQQNLAVIGLLKAAHQNLFENHLNTCFARAFKTTNEKLQKDMIKEILKVSKMANK
jgi:CsoR family transcriptional regulator, copper-sensing transcriptional repressor